ncbi:MAG: T9SS type A sorting domain-containing protein [Chitinispirillaceae bacterium]|nr:T9SS type A sorting domain-containing protein [Chitinispirillaceae bacterium]
MVLDSLYSNTTLKPKIDRYIQDIGGAYGCKVEVEAIRGGTPVQLKDLIKGYYTNGGLNGVIMIGQFAPAMFFDPDTRYGGYFACDLFYSDLDGTWGDDGGDGRYETHVAGSGDRAPEVFLGRIDTKTMGSFGKEVDLMARYFDKNHNYWAGNIPLKKSAYVHIEPDWQSSTNYVSSIYGTANTGIVRGTGTRESWLNTTLKTDYSFVHLWCHAGWSAHSFHTGGSLNYTTIYNAKPVPIGYAHDGCHVADWVACTNRGYVVGSYVYSESPTSLVVISGTKTGQWLGHKGQLLFDLMGKNYCIGQAYLEWFTPYINNTRDWAYFVLWDYGYCIIGDPMISMISVMRTNVEKTTAPASISADRLKCTNSSSYRTLALSYDLPRSAFVTLKMYNGSGKAVKSVVNEFQKQGIYSVAVATETMPAGIYIVKLQSGSSAISKLTQIVK